MLAMSGTAAMPKASAESTVTVGAVNDVVGWNPYADGASQMYVIWCHTCSCLRVRDSAIGEYEGLLAERWADGKEQSADIVYALWRIDEHYGISDRISFQPRSTARFRNRHHLKVTQGNGTLRPPMPSSHQEDTNA